MKCDIFAKSLKLVGETSMEDVSTLYVSLCAKCMHGIHSNQRRTLDHLEQQLQMFVPCQYGWRERNVGTVPEKQVLLAAESSLQPRCRHCKFWISWIIQKPHWSKLQCLLSDGCSFPWWECAAKADHIHSPGTLRLYFQRHSEKCLVFSIENETVVIWGYSTFSKNEISYKWNDVYPIISFHICRFRIPMQKLVVKKSAPQRHLQVTDWGRAIELYLLWNPLCRDSKQLSL